MIASILKQYDLNLTAIQTTGTYVAKPYDMVRCDNSTANVFVTLPTAPANGTRIGVRIVKTAYVYFTVVTAGGSDLVDLAGNNYLSLNGVNQTAVLVYDSANAIWIEQDNSDATPTIAFEQAVRQNSLDQMAPPAGSVNMNSQKVIQMGQGTVGTDSANLNQSNYCVIRDINPWVRVSNTSFTITTVSTDLTSTYKNGVRLAWTESLVWKFGIVASSSYSAGVTTVVMQAIDGYVMAASPDATLNFYYKTIPPNLPINETVSATITGGVTVALTTGTTVLTTPTLDVGKWLVKVSVSYLGGGATRMVTTNVSVASGTATSLPYSLPLAGGTLGFGTATATANSYLEFILTVTAACTLTINGTALVAAVTTHADASSYFIAERIN